MDKTIALGTIGNIIDIIAAATSVIATIKAQSGLSDDEIAATAKQRIAGNHTERAQILASLGVTE